MDLSLIGIPFTFVVICAVLLWFIILGKGHWLIKVIAVPLVLYFNFVIWNSLGNISGWAAESPLPKKFGMLWAFVHEPSNSDILIWANALDDENEIVETKPNSWLAPFSSKKNSDEPRVYRLPYTRETHEKVQQAMQSLAKGKKVGGSQGKAKGEGQQNPEGYGKEDGKKGQGKDGSLSQEQEFMLYELPPIKLPEKD
jgi:hypothetical protein